MPAASGSKGKQPQDKQGRDKPFDININDSVDGRSSISATSAKTHISKWEKQVAISDTSSTTHIPKEIEEDVDDMLGCCQMFRFFLKHAWRDVTRRTGHFCLAFCSVFVVVLSTLVVNTIISKGPIIFLKLAQEDAGEFDGVFSPGGGYDPAMNSFSDMSRMLNYTHVEELYKDEFNLAPRWHTCHIQARNYQLKEPCLMVWDTKREEEIELAPGYPYDPLGYGECLVPENYKEQSKLKVGDTIDFSLDLGTVWRYVVEAYNELAEEAGWSKLPDISPLQ